MKKGFIRLVEVALAFVIIFTVMTNIQVNIPPRYSDVNDVARLQRYAEDIAFSVCNSEDYRYDLVNDRIPVNLSIRIDNWDDKNAENPNTLTALNGTARQQTIFNFSASQIRICIEAQNITSNADVSICEEDDDLDCIAGTFSSDYTISSGANCTQWFDYALNKSKVRRDNKFVLMIHSENFENLTYYEDGRKGYWFKANVDETQTIAFLNYTEYSNNPLALYVETLHDMRISELLPSDLSYGLWLYSNDSTNRWGLNTLVNSSTPGNSPTKQFSIRVYMQDNSTSTPQINGIYNTYSNGTASAIDTTDVFDNGTKTDTVTSSDYSYIENNSVSLEPYYTNETNNLVSYWKFENNLNDETKRNNLTCTSCPSYDGSGKIGTSAIFNGSSYANASYGIIKTISYWVKYSSTQTGIIYPTFYNQKSQGAQPFWWMYTVYADLTVNLQYWNSTNNVVVNWNNAVEYNNWTHVAVVTDTDAQTITYYKNGVNLGTKNASNINISTNGIIYLGTYQKGAVYMLNGSMDEVMIFDRSLSSTEILDIFNNSTKFKTSGNFKVADQNLNSSLSVTNTTITFSGDDNNYINRVEWLVDGDVKKTEYVHLTGDLKSNDLFNDPSLVSYWKLDGNVIDEKSRNNGNSSSTYTANFENSMDGFGIGCGGLPTSAYVSGKIESSLKFWSTGGDGLACVYKSTLGIVNASYTLWFYGKGYVGAGLYNNSVHVSYLEDVETGCKTPNGQTGVYSSCNSNLPYDDWKLFRLVAYVNSYSAVTPHFYDGHGIGEGNATYIDYVTNGPIPSAGKYDLGYSFDGYDDYINESISLNVSGNQVTLAAWVNPSLTSAWTAIAGINANGNAQYNLGLNNGNRFRFLVVNDTAGNEAYANAINNTWQFVVGVYNGTHVSIYVNGILKQSTAHSGNLKVSAAPFLIGKNWDGLYKGNIDEVALFNRSLSDVEVLQLYNQSRISFSETELPIYDSSKNDKATSSCLISGYGSTYAPKKFVVGVWNI